MGSPVEPPVRWLLAAIAASAVLPADLAVAPWVGDWSARSLLVMVLAISAAMAGCVMVWLLWRHLQRVCDEAADWQAYHLRQMRAVKEALEDLVHVRIPAALTGVQVPGMSSGPLEQEIALWLDQVVRAAVGAAKSAPRCPAADDGGPLAEILQRLDALQERLPADPEAGRGALVVIGRRQALAGQPCAGEAERA